MTPKLSYLGSEWGMPFDWNYQDWQGFTGRAEGPEGDFYRVFGSGNDEASKRFQNMALFGIALVAGLLIFRK